MKVEPLEGDYCPECAMTLATGKWKSGSIVPLCKKCLNEMVRVGDLVRAQKFVFSQAESELEAVKAERDRYKKALEIVADHTSDFYKKEKTAKEVLAGGIAGGGAKI